MTRIPKLVLIAAFAFARPASAAGRSMAATKYEFSLTRRKRPAGGEILHKTYALALYRATDGRVRQEILTKSGTRIVELFGVTPPRSGPKGMYFLDPAKKTYYEDLKSGLHLRSSSSAAETELSKDLGEKLIVGTSCHGWGGIGKSSKYVEIWRCQFPGTRMSFVGEVIERFPDGSGESLLLTGTKPGIRVPLSLFEIPKNFRPEPPPE